MKNTGAPSPGPDASPILLACPRATIYSFDYNPIKPVRYEDTEHYRIYRELMEDRSKYLKNEER